MADNVSRGSADNHEIIMCRTYHIRTDCAAHSYVPERRENKFIKNER